MTIAVPPIALTHSGARVHLVSPDRASIHIFDVAEHLARLCRYSGAPNIPFSVAQHSLVVAQAMYEAGDALAAVYGMLHDAHEAYMGDISEPTASAIEFRFAGIRDVLDSLRADLDIAIHGALDLDYPLPPDTQRLLDHVHARVVMTELRDVLTGCDAELFLMRRHGVVPLTRRIRPFATYVQAAEQWLEHLRRYAALAGIGTRAI